jgi:hypothetical protein
MIVNWNHDILNRLHREARLYWPADHCYEEGSAHLIAVALALCPDRERFHQTVARVIEEVYEADNPILNINKH